jgi:hypothetical protein
MILLASCDKRLSPYSIQSIACVSSSSRPFSFPFGLGHPEWVGQGIRHLRVKTLSHPKWTSGQQPDPFPLGIPYGNDAGNRAVSATDDQLFAPFDPGNQRLLP